MEIIQKEEEGVVRDYCIFCKEYFYDNPLPVASAIVTRDRKILLVKRGKEPYKGKWCLPSGFAETNETIEDAALRELKEETGIKGRIVGMVDVESCNNYFYGDLIFLTFEVTAFNSEAIPGSDTVSVKYFPVEELPDLAFKPNTKAVQTFLKNKAEYWSIIDSFAQAVQEEEKEKAYTNLISDRLVDLVEKNADLIGRYWLQDVIRTESTYRYHSFDSTMLYERVFRVLSQFGKWLKGFYSEEDFKQYYVELGRERKREGFGLSEVLNALTLVRRNIWKFALSHGVWTETLNIYMALELDMRIVTFFDKAMHYTSIGYTEQTENQKIS